MQLGCCALYRMPLHMSPQEHTRSGGWQDAVTGGKYPLHPRDDRSLPPPGGGGGGCHQMTVPPPGGRTPHTSKPEVQHTQLEFFFGACDFLLISYCSWAK